MTTTFDNFIASLEDFIDTEYLRQKDPQGLIKKFLKQANEKLEKPKRKPNWFEDWEEE